MKQRLHNYRVEFYGGPNDGEILYQRARPIETYIIASQQGNAIVEHYYQLTWKNEFQAKYIYGGVTVEG